MENVSEWLVVIFMLAIPAIVVIASIWLPVEKAGNRLK